MLARASGTMEGIPYRLAVIRDRFGRRTMTLSMLFGTHFQFFHQLRVSSIAFHTFFHSFFFKYKANMEEIGIHSKPEVKEEKKKKQALWFIDGFLLSIG